MREMGGAVKLLAQVQLGTGATLIYTAPVGTTSPIARLAGLWLCNTDSAIQTATIRVGVGTLTAANSLGEAWSIPANTTFFISFEFGAVILPAGYKLEGLSGAAAKVTCTLFGEEIT